MFSLSVFAFNTTVSFYVPMLLEASVKGLGFLMTRTEQFTGHRMGDGSKPTVTSDLRNWD